MKNTLRALAIVAGILLVPVWSVQAQWSAESGSTVRDAFGPQSGNSANQCRGACGGGCPDSCTRTVSYECAGEAQLRRVVTHDCGTHEGCRVHDNCLDRCVQEGGQGDDCATQCDAEVMQHYGLANAATWLMGKGPYDGRISFEYTRDADGAPTAMFSCPQGTDRQCGASAGCVAGGAWFDPVFDSYPDTDADALRISNFRSGPSCGDQVCTQSADIQVSGGDVCAGGDCTRFAIEFDYQNADPSAPLECTPSTRGGADDSDFVGQLLKQGADAMDSRGTAPDPNSDDGMQALLGVFQQALSSADSPEDVAISITPHGQDGKPIESQRVGSAATDESPPIPRRIDLPSADGHLFVPMYQLVNGIKPGQIKERRIRCTHKGVPVLDTTFRLRAG